ncbi:hypothetical protein D3C81_2321430 [compost metagenome]
MFRYRQFKNRISKKLQPFIVLMLAKPMFVHIGRMGEGLFQELLILECQLKFLL